MLTIPNLKMVFLVFSLVKPGTRLALALARTADGRKQKAAAMAQAKWKLVEPKWDLAGRPRSSPVGRVFERVQVMFRDTADSGGGETAWTVSYLQFDKLTFSSRIWGCIFTERQTIIKDVGNILGIRVFSSGKHLTHHSHMHYFVQCEDSEPNPAQTRVQKVSFKVNQNSTPTCPV